MSRKKAEMRRPWADERADRWNDPKHLQRVIEHLASRHAAVTALLTGCMRERELAAVAQDQVLENIKFAIQVLGGETASATDFADCCLVGRKRIGGTQWFASGVLVHPRVVVTANHVDAEGRDPDVVALPTDGAGTIPDNVRRSGTFFPHQSADLAVIVLDKAVEPAVAPVALASKTEFEAAVVTTVVGFGSNAIARATMERKLHAEVSIDVAKRKNETFVAGGGGQGACHGDSGGPAYIRVGNQTLLAGITSGPEDPNGLCGDPTRFTRVDAFQPFITSHFPP